MLYPLARVAIAHGARPECNRAYFCRLNPIIAPINSTVQAGGTYQLDRRAHLNMPNDTYQDMGRADVFRSLCPVRTAK